MVQVLKREKRIVTTHDGKQLVLRRLVPVTNPVQSRTKGIPSAYVAAAALFKDTGVCAHVHAQLKKLHLA